LETPDNESFANVFLFLASLRQEMQNELADLRMAWQGHGQATEAFKSAVLKDMETKRDGLALELNSRLEDIEAQSGATSLELKDRLDGLVSQVSEHTTRLDYFSPRVEAVESKFSADLATSQGQVEASLSGLSGFREEMQNELADLRKVSQRNMESVEAFQTTMLKAMEAKRDGTHLYLNNRLKDIQAKIDTTALQVLEHATRLDGFTPQVEAAESALSAEVSTSQGQVEASLSCLAYLRQEMQNELSSLRKASEGHRDATEAFQLAASAIETKNDAMTFEMHNKLQDIESKTASQLKDRLGVLEQRTRIDDSSVPRLKAVGSPLQAQKDGHKFGSRGEGSGHAVQVGRIFPKEPNSELLA
jgi:hypothetical protein